MKKIILALLLLVPLRLYADYYDVQWNSVVPSTTTPSTEWNYRGNVYLVDGDTTTASLIADCTKYILLYATGTIRAESLYVSTATITSITGTISTATYALDSDKLDGQEGIYYLSASSATATYLYKNEKAADSELLDGYNYDYFLGTTTAASTYHNSFFNIPNSELCYSYISNN